MKFAIVAAVALVAATGAAAAPPPTIAPREIAAPAWIVHAHPEGHALHGPADAIDPATVPAPAGPSRRLAGRRLEERRYCWRVYLSNDQSGWGATERENWNPAWCGNGSDTRSYDPSWHWESCSWPVFCSGESGPFVWGGCDYGCYSVGGEIIGRFQNWSPWGPFTDTLYIADELYGNGQWWAYTWMG